MMQMHAHVLMLSVNTDTCTALMHCLVQSAQDCTSTSQTFFTTDILSQYYMNTETFSSIVKHLRLNPSQYNSSGAPMQERRFSMQYSSMRSTQKPFPVQQWSTQIPFPVQQWSTQYSNGAPKSLFQYSSGAPKNLFQYNSGKPKNLFQYIQ